MKTLWMKSGALCVVLVIVMITTTPQHPTQSEVTETTLDKPSYPAYAHIHGWNTYSFRYNPVFISGFGYINRDLSLYEDYSDPTGRFSGYNISDATIYKSDGSSFILPLDPTYIENANYEVNVAVVLWNLHQNVRGFSFAREIMDKHERHPRYLGFRKYYDTYMNALSESERITAWYIFESRHCAYDMKLPVIQSLKMKDHNLTLHATDNVGIARVEWLVGDEVYSTSFSSPSVVTSLDLTKHKQSPGESVVVMCRVYDFEGVQTGDRPREDRFAWRKVNVTIPNLRPLTPP